MDLGIFGGTFNPIHMGHLRAAEEVREALALDKLLFVPAKLPPHKGPHGIAPPDLRLQLVRQAVAGNPQFEVSALELEREGPSYSVDTLAAIREQLGPADRLWFVMGSDTFDELHTWHCYAELFALADIAVMSRPPRQAPVRVPLELADRFVATATGYRHESGREVRSVPVTLLDISSTQVRSVLAAGRSLRYLVPDPVREVLTATAAEHPDWFAGSNP